MGRKKYILSFFTLISFMVVSCEQRDPQAEFEVLCKTVYSSPQEGEEAAQEYINHFGKKEGARFNEVSEIRDQYRKMVAFFSVSFSSYADFLGKSRDLNYDLSFSKYDGVRRMWVSHYESVKNRLLAPLMDSITASDFDSFFQEQVKQLSDSEFDNWTIESVEQVSLSTPILIAGGTAKKSSGEYWVHLRGRHVSLVTSTARISIEGTIGPDENGDIIPNRTRFSFLRKPMI